MTDFKVGDRVRCMQDNERYPKYPKGAEFIVSEISGYGTVVKSPDGVEHANFCLELVEEPEIKVGDRVKATSKTNEDTAEFTVTSATSTTVASTYNYFLSAVWDFEIVAPPKPTPQEVWDSFPIGQRFYFGDADATYEKVKVTAEKFYNPELDFVDTLRGYLSYGVIPIDN